MERVFGKLELDIFHVEQLGILLHERVLRLDQDLDQRFLVEVHQRRDHRQAADELRDQAELQQVFGLAILQRLARLALVRSRHMGAETDRLALQAVGDDLLETRKGAAADEQDVRRVDLQELLLRMLAPALRRNGRGRAFHELEQRLLHALARYVARDRRIVRLAADLIDLVDVDDAALRLFDIIVGGLEQLEDDVLDVLADIAGLGQRRRIRHRERHVENARQRLREQRLAAAGRADQQDIRLGKLDLIARFRAMGESLV